MKDYFKEQLVKKLYTKDDTKKRVIIMFAAAFVLLFFWELINSVAVLNPDYYYSLMILMLFLAIGDIFIACKFVNNLNKEFEYVYTDGCLDIDAIINKRKRKRVFSGYVEEFEVMAPYGDVQHLAIYDGLKTVDFSSGTVKDNTYVFVSVYKSKKKKYIFEPCSEIVTAIRSDLSSRRLFLKNR